MSDKETEIKALQKHIEMLKKNNESLLVDYFEFELKKLKELYK